MDETDTENNKVKENFIKDYMDNLKKDIENVFKDDVDKIKETNKTADNVQIIPYFNKDQKREGLKLLTPNQMLSRLPNYLAQLKAGNNSEKLKNEIIQLFYSLYRSKKLTKNICKSFIDII